MNIAIRDERPGDAAAIHALTESAFADMPFSDGTEQHVIDRLRAARALFLSRVAEDGGQIVGHIALAPVRIGGRESDWVGLGPVSVTPPLHRRGIGGQLIRDALAAARTAGKGGCVLVGSTDYYPRFGFRQDGRLFVAGPMNAHFQWQDFGGDVPAGEVRFHPAFDD